MSAHNSAYSIQGTKSCPSQDSPSQNCDLNTPGRSTDRVRLKISIFFILI